MPGEERKLADLNFGIIGAGHLGLTMAQVFINSFLPPRNLLISYKGSIETGRSLEKMGLSDQVVSVDELCRLAEIVLIFVRPQSFVDFRITSIGANTLFVSGIAGVPLSRLEKVFGKNICRIMTSGPDTIHQHKAMAAIYPFNEMVNRMMSATGFTVMILNEEQEMHYFTVGVCLPAALVLAKKLGVKVEIDPRDREPGYAIIHQLFLWAKSVIPQFVSTPGGITEAILLNLEKSRNLLQALDAGVERSMTISDGFAG